MAIINSYPSAEPTAVDYVLGVRFDEDGHPTKLFPLQGIVDLVEEQIPQGPQGPQGEQGVQGEQGIQGEQGLNWVGVWIAFGDFVVDDAVSYDGSSWICILDTGSLATPPSSDPTHWQLLTAKGSQGPQGIPGVSGTYGLFAQTSDGGPVTATTVETTIVGPGVGTLTVPANGFQIGDSFQASLDGIISCVGTATIHVHVKTLAGTILADTGIIALDTTTSKSWLLTTYFTIRTLGVAGIASISSGGLFSYIKNSGTNFEGYVLSNINNTTFDTTVDNTLVITVQWNTTNADNSILSRNFTLTKVY